MKTDTPVVRIFLARMKSQFLELPESARNQFMERDRANLDALGMKAISMIDCTDSDGEWDYIGVELWPSMKAVEERERFEREELQISRYVDYEVHLGVEQSFAEYGRSR